MTPLQAHPHRMLSRHREGPRGCTPPPTVPDRNRRSSYCTASSSLLDRRGTQKNAEIVRPYDGRGKSLPKREMQIPDGKKPRRDPSPSRQRMMFYLYFLHMLSSSS